MVSLSFVNSPLNIICLKKNNSSEWSPFNGRTDIHQNYRFVDRIGKKRGVRMEEVTKFSVEVPNSPIIITNNGLNATNKEEIYFINKCACGLHFLRLRLFAACTLYRSSKQDEQKKIIGTAMFSFFLSKMKTENEKKKSPTIIIITYYAWKRMKANEKTHHPRSKEIYDPQKLPQNHIAESFDFK